MPLVTFHTKMHGRFFSMAGDTRRSPERRAAVLVISVVRWTTNPVLDKGEPPVSVPIRDRPDSEIVMR